MSRTGGDKTKKKILEAAERLFSRNGLNATSINRITREAGVNKALVYYYFKDKADIVVSLFTDIIEELSNLEPAKTDGRPAGTDDPREALKAELSFLEGRKNIVSVMLMEALKSDDKDTSLFQCSELVVAHEHGGTGSPADIVFEFFTGFIPLIAFVALKGKFCDYFGMDEKEAVDHFVSAFIASHIKTQEVHG